MNGFSVDPGELDAVAGRARALADGVREDAVWRYGVDVERWPADDPLRAAIARYQQSLQDAVVRLCGSADKIADRLTATAETYRRGDEEQSAVFGDRG
ncbi:type VII secretion target [Actinokineospora soli]|uniref:Type VII secretion target n=1 Tax=Actinokineospora soli TaxID=1048753 RepID=A0ABW2TXE1_9PSEU